MVAQQRRQQESKSWISAGLLLGALLLLGASLAYADDAASVHLGEYRLLVSAGLATAQLGEPPQGITGEYGAVFVKTSSAQ